MNTDRQELFEVIQACLDGSATDEQAARLNARLRADEESRDLYLQLADTHSCLAVDESLWVDAVPAKNPYPAIRSERRAWMVRRSLVAAAAGIVLGICCTSVVFAFVAASRQNATIIFQESFESGSAGTVPGLPRRTDHWAGDEAAVVSASANVQPLHGAKMLRCVSATHVGEGSPRSQWCDVYRLIEVRGPATAGGNVARVSASFAQDQLPSERQFFASVEAIALEQELSELPSSLDLPWLQRNNSALGSRRLALKTAGHWHEVSVEVPVTPETRFVLLHLAIVQEQPRLPVGAAQFSGHYIDDVKVELVRRP